MKWLWPLLLAPSIVLAGIGTVEHDEGRTWNERSNKTENIDIGYDVLMDDFFQTGEDGQIGIIFEDDTSVTVIENSELLIDDFVYDPASNTGELAFNVTVGSFRYVSGAAAANNAGYNLEVPFSPGRADAFQEQTEIESFAVLEP